MSEGLCMFDASARLILCNERYLEMYGLRPEIAKPGCSLRELLDERKRANTFAGDPEQYIAEALRRMRSGQSVQDVREMPDGRFISIASRPMAGGGWVATHQDITERRKLDQQRDRLASQEQRRATIEAAIASFRHRVEAMLKTVSDGAAAMRATCQHAVSILPQGLPARGRRCSQLKRGLGQCRDRRVRGQRAFFLHRRDQSPARANQQAGRDRRA
jgi:hypothetical protein